ncbi:hypothetical protein A8F94_06185 [Bacillus sp. FJAT-27225]|uniref:cytochrome c-type biogenesis protein CcmH n=1 Tax=Bacillus sp. FJAT-27225 TaxID=1743144 RepID=UPI00080C2EF5|nr:cytochrome c-type biogenesis protein CcmH [Bacillus sp. FJAT-27225]OCA91440.1 hypothetical protein A8F94_06185 [Bacillus sp. FJAT-27225]
MEKNLMAKAAILFAVMALSIFPSAVMAAYTANSPEFREVTGQLHMDGHSDHELSTCKVRKVYNSEVLEMLNKGMQPDDIIRHYTDELGPQALKVPDTKGSGLIAWIIPGIGVLAGGAVVSVAIRRVTARKAILEKVNEDSTDNAGSDFSNFEKTLENERKKHF